jgi:tetratricopeptide (TPR) repeat protein
MPPKPKNPGKFPALLLFLATVIPAFGQMETNKIFFARAETEFLAAQKIFELNTNEAAAAWRFGHASFDWADCATNNTQRAEFARTGIAACREALAREPKSAPAHYYLAMNFGQLAQAEAPSMAAYKLVREIEREFKAATELDEKFDFGGPPRCLGLLYRDAPGWPVSIGSKRKAREWLDRAEALAPEFPENPLNLAETHLQWHQHAEAEKAFAQLDAGWAAAQTNLAGASWEKSWQEWTGRRAAAHAEFNRLYPGKKSPVK